MVFLVSVRLVLNIWGIGKTAELRRFVEYHSSRHSSVNGATVFIADVAAIAAYDGVYGEELTL